ncbi:phage tail protein [Pectobacterium carotovorum]|uniref:phage tail protein n=1 Tax=Pectobacterium carotovorum TaxID=554 RepID=UPI001CF19A29|nr:phage tail protein [Pectobacterium carotovorum]MCA6971216.1 phage tail protein [Pectobacterium carotovorum]
MPDFRQQLESLRLPSWMDKGEPAKLLRASKRYWQQVNDWMRWPLQQLDAETCPVPLLNVLAYQRDIERFNGEPLSLFRKRVKWAFINAQDAGSVAGFIRIFARLDVGAVELKERQAGYEWDVILVRINDEQLSTYNTLMMNLVMQYGRTCRRYNFDVLNEVTTRVYAGTFSHSAEYYSADTDTRHGLVMLTQYAAAPDFSALTEYHTASL